MIITLSSYGQIISDNQLGQEIYSKIISEVAKNNQVTLDFTNVRTMATYNAKQIFGRLYFNLGSKDFFDKIHFKNLSQNMQAIIRLGINDFLEKNKGIQSSI